MLEILSYDFMQRALLASLIIGFLGSYFGVFVVQRKMSFLGSGLSHAAFGGVALGLLLQTEPLYLAIPFTVLSAVLIIYLRDKTKLSTDTTIGIIFSVTVALGVVFLSIKDTYSADAYSYLFGSILSVASNDIWTASILAIITLILGYKYWSSWTYATFDKEFAVTDKIPVKRHDYILSILLSITIVTSIKVVGMLLISAYLVLPAAIARLISKTFFQMTLYSIIIGILSSVAGIFISYFLDLPSGAVIILLQSLIFLIASIIYRK